MIDANVFEPRPGRTDATRKKAFIDPTDAGWNAVLRVKPHLLPWIADVTARAGALGKTLITVSHYPVLDPFADAAGSEVALFGQTSFARRTPGPAVAQALRAAGVRWHAGGHLHVNSVTQSGGLTNVALPSLVSYPPAFGIVTALGADFDLETLSLADLPPDPDLTALYSAEGRMGPGLPYGAFVETQFRARLSRRIARDWPADVRAALHGKTMADLVAMLGGQGGDATPLEQVIADAYVLREAGDLAGLAPDRMAALRAIAVFGDAAADPKASPVAFLRRFLSVLQVSLTRLRSFETSVRTLQRFHSISLKKSVVMTQGKRRRAAKQARLKLDLTIRAGQRVGGDPWTQRRIQRHFAADNYVAILQPFRCLIVADVIDHGQQIAQRRFQFRHRFAHIIQRRFHFIHQAPEQQLGPFLHQAEAFISGRVLRHGGRQGQGQQQGKGNLFHATNMGRLDDNFNSRLWIGEIQRDGEMV